MASVTKKITTCVANVLKRWKKMKKIIKIRICYEYAMITWITLRWIEKCCHSEVFWCGIQSKINWSRSRALGYNLADADSYHVVPRSTTYIPFWRLIHFQWFSALLALPWGHTKSTSLSWSFSTVPLAFELCTSSRHRRRVTCAQCAKTVKGVQDKCVMPPTLFHDRRWQALWLLNIVDLGCKRTCHDSVVDAEFFLDSKWSTQSTQSTHSILWHFLIDSLPEVPSWCEANGWATSCGLCIAQT